MVEHKSLNSIFKSLADPTRRDILARLYDREQTISQLAKNYDMSFAATAKHIAVLERARLVTKSRIGKEQLVSINSESLQLAEGYIKNYANLWSDRFDKLDNILNKEQ